MNKPIWSFVLSIVLTAVSSNTFADGGRGAPKGQGKGAGNDAVEELEQERQGAGAFYKKVGTQEILSIEGADLILKPIDGNQIPGLERLIKTIYKMPIPDYIRSRLLIATQPGKNRKYFIVPDASPETMEKWKRRYVNLMAKGQNEGEFFIAALTAPRKKSTTLFPAFFEVGPGPSNKHSDFQRANEKDILQAAMLFHEVVRIIKPEVTYEDVVNHELIFLKYLRDVEASTVGSYVGKNYWYSEALCTSLEEIFDDASICIKSALLRDISEGRHVARHRMDGVHNGVLVDLSYLVRDIFYLQLTPISQDDQNKLCDTCGPYTGGMQMALNTNKILALQSHLLRQIAIQRAGSIFEKNANQFDQVLHSRASEMVLQEIPDIKFQSNFLPRFNMGPIYLNLESSMSTPNVLVIESTINVDPTVYISTGSVVNKILLVGHLGFESGKK